MCEGGEFQQWKWKLLNLRTFICIDYSLTSIFLTDVLNKSPLLLRIASSLLGLASWACNLCSHTGPRAQKSTTAGFTFRILNLKFLILEKKRAWPFHFVTDSAKCVAGPAPSPSLTSHTPLEFRCLQLLIQTSDRQEIVVLGKCLGSNWILLWLRLFLVVSTSCHLTCCSFTFVCGEVP